MNYNKLTLKMAKNLMAPHTWVASILPSLFGCLYCYLRGYHFPMWEALLIIIACILMQSSVNVLNDYIDFVKGADSKDDNLERSDAVLLYENINPRSALALSIVLFLIAAGIGVVLIIASSCLIPLWIGLIGALTILLYSCGKTPISYLPIGELVSGVVMGGLIPLGCVAVANQSWHFKVLIYAIPFIIGIALIMMSNNGCDIEKDIEAGRKTLPALLGRKKTRKLYSVLVYLWIFSLLILPLFMMGVLGASVFIITLLVGKKALFWLIDSPLDQEHRVEQMKKVLAANIVANGSYILVMIIISIILFYKDVMSGL